MIRWDDSSQSGVCPGAARPFLRPRGLRGSSTAEQVLLLSVLLVALLGLAPLFTQALQAGVLGLSQDVVEMLTGRRAPSDLPAGSASDGNSGGGGGSHDLPQLPGGTADAPGGDSSGSDGSDSGDSGSGDSGSDDSGGASAPGSSDEAPPEEEESTCPYVYDETSERWRDPETGQYVSGAAASQAGC